MKSLILHTDKEVDLDGWVDQESGVTFIGKAQRLEDGVYTCLAKTGDTHHAVKIYIGVRAPTLVQLRRLVDAGRKMSNQLHHAVQVTDLSSAMSRVQLRKDYEEWDEARSAINFSPIVVLAEPRPK